MSTTISGNLKDLTTTAVATNCFVRFYLRGCNGSQARANGLALIPPAGGAVWYQDFIPDASGVISGTLYSNNVDIDTTLTPGSHPTFYGVQVFSNGVPGPETPYTLSDGVAFNLNSATANTTNPVVASPTGDTTYLRLDAGNLGPAANPYPFPGVLSAATGFRNGTMTAGRVLRSNGTNFVAAQLAAADLSDGTNGTGSITLTNSPTLVTPTLGVASSTQISASNLSGQSNSAFKASGAGTIGVGWNNTTGVADQKWADATLSTTSWLLRFVNDANSVGSTIMQATRGALSAVATIVFGAGGGVQTLFTSTDTIVGKATTDTLSNKTFTGAGGANTLEFLNAQGAAGALTGNSADQTVYTFTVPANTVGPGKGIRVKVMYLKNVGTVSTTFKLIIGAVTIESNAYVVSTANNQFEMWELDIFNNAGVQNAQFWMAQEVIFDTAATRVRMNAGTSAVDFTASQAVKFTFNVAATDQLTPKFWSVELIQ